MRPLHLTTHRMPRVADILAVSTRHPHHDRRRELVRRAPSHGAAIVELFVRRVRVLAELNFRYRHQPGERHADRSSNDPFLREAGVEYAALAELPLQPFRHEVNSTFPAHV